MISTSESTRLHFSLDKKNDCTAEMAGLRRAFLREHTNVSLSSLRQYCCNRAILSEKPFGHEEKCLEMLGCYGHGSAKKLAQSCAAPVLSGATSLTTALVIGDRLTAHERMGRNRPGREAEDRDDERSGR